MEPRRITKGDFDQIVEVIDRWWGGPIGTFAHPIFFYELGEKALIVEDGGRLVGFLLGFIAHEPVKTGYVHLVGIHPEYRRRGVGRMLYETFTDTCRAAECVRMKAITTLGQRGLPALPPRPRMGVAGNRGLCRPFQEAHRLHERLGGSPPVAGQLRRRMVLTILSSPR